MSAPDDREKAPLETLLTLLNSAREFAAQVVDDPLVERLLAAFSRLPQPDRESIVGVIERDATWCRIVEQTADTTGISVRPNPQASLYVHVVAPQTEPPDAPLRRDVDIIRFGLERFVHMLPFLFQPGVHQQWVTSAKELIADASPELREHALRMCREVLELIADAPAPA